MADGRATQVISPALDLRLLLVDLTELPAAERSDQIFRLAQEEAGRPIDLAHGPLLRMTLLRLSEAEHVLLLTLHHLVGDAWSLDILLRELLTLYRAFAAGQPSPLEELPVQYADFAVWQRGWLRGAVLERELSYWRPQLAGPLPSIEIPTDRPRSSTLSFQTAMHSFKLPASLSTAIRLLSQREGVTPFMTLLAAFDSLLSLYTGQDDIIVATPIANRDRSEIEGLIGFFVNTLALRTDLSGDPTFEHLLGRVREVVIEAHAHRELHITEVEEHLGLNLRFPVMFAFENVPNTWSCTTPQTVLDISLMNVEYRALGRRDLNVSLWDDNTYIGGCVLYNADIFDETRVISMVEDFRAILKTFTEEPKQRLSVVQKMIRD
jgi:hypothetical protein